MTLEQKVALLTEACQLFTRGLGSDHHGYYESLGAPKTEKAIKLMREAGVEPVYCFAVAKP